MLRVLLVHPGAEWSISDVWRGVNNAMRRAGVEVVNYAMAGRLQRSQKWLKDTYKQARKNHPDEAIVEPTMGDGFYHASVGALERALRFQADWVFIISGMYFHPEAMVLLKRAGLNVAVLLTETPYEDAAESAIAQIADVIWTNERTGLATFEPLCHETYYYQHAYDPEFPYPAEPDPSVPEYDVVFVGSGFEERCDLLEAVDWTGINLGLYGAWNLLPKRSKLKKYLRGSTVPNTYTAALYNRAKIGLNIHRTSLGYGRGTAHIEHAESMNPRCYELAACGTFFTTDARAEVGEVFGSAVPTFSDAQELTEIIRHYLAHEDERRRLAAQLPGLVAPHTFDDRVAHMLGTLESYKR